MNVTFYPSLLRGSFASPGSKSEAHRALICAALAGGGSRIEGLTPSEDVLSTLDCLRALGAGVQLCDGAAAVTGTAGKCSSGSAVLPCRESGTTLRLLIPYALVHEKEITFTGSPRLFARPLGIYEELCRENGLLFQRGEDSLTVGGPLRPGAYTVAGNVSSQFISGLCMALPLLEGDSCLTVTPPVESLPYIRLTLAWMERFGVSARMNENRIELPGGQKYRPRCAAISGDWSAAAAFAAWNELGGAVALRGLESRSCQADRMFPSYFAALRQGRPALVLADCPDLGPVCMALAAALHGAEFTGTARLRWKESDRCAAMAQELAKFGAQVVLGDDCVEVAAADPLHAPAEPLDAHNDHRVVMALSLLASAVGGTIRGAEAVAKSMPDFFARLVALGAHIDITENTL